MDNYCGTFTYTIESIQSSNAADRHGDVIALFNDVGEDYPATTESSTPFGGPDLPFIWELYFEIPESFTYINIAHSTYEFNLVGTWYPNTWDGEWDSGTPVTNDKTKSKFSITVSNCDYEIVCDGSFLHEVEV